MKRHNLIAVLSAAIATLALGSMVMPASASESTSQQIQELVELNPGSSYESMRNDAQSEADREGKPLSDVVNSALKEARLHTNLTRSNNNQATIPLTPARNAGDVFYSPVSTADIHHGHSGIFSRKDMIVHAPGPRRTVEETNYRNVRVASGGQLQYVNTSQGNRDRAVRLSRTFKGRAYNYNFPFNKTSKGSMNCSQVVWVSYKDGAGIDLDFNGGPGVYPSDIMQSKWTITYKRY